MKYAYQRQGGPLLNWTRAAPQQTRAADAKALGCGCGPSLGSLGDDSLGAMELPRPGAPEPIAGVVDTVTRLPLPAKIAGAVGLYFLFKKLKKRR